MHMRSFWRFLLFFLVTLFVLWLFRAPLYRAVVCYHVVGERSPLKELGPSAISVADLNAAILASLDTTAARLHFSSGPVTNDPRKLLPGSPANCMGYAALFSALLKGQLQQAGIGDRYDVQAVIGKLHIGGLDLHSLFDDPFWKDHDIVRIEDGDTGEVIFVDPTLYDVLGIERVSAAFENAR